MTQDEIREICISHNVDPDGAEMFNDDYIISRTGDLICGMNWSYGIYDYMLDKDDWIPHLRRKNWYNDATFVPAYLEALRKHGIYSKSIQVYDDIFITVYPSRTDIVALCRLLKLISVLDKRILMLKYG